MKYIQKLPPKYSTKIYYIALIARAFINFFTQTIFGSFVLLTLVYLCLLSTKFNKPYSLGELLVFVDGLSSDYKIAIASSTITILGFLFAFHAATLAWKQQAIANIKITAANEVLDFFNEVVEIASDISIYAKNLSQLAEEIKNVGANQHTSFSIKYLSNRREVIESQRNKITEFSSQVYLIQSNHFVALADSSAGKSLLQQATSALSEFANAMWFSYPIVNEDATEPEKLFLAQLQIEKVTQFLEIADKKILVIGSIASGLKGLLISPVMHQGLYVLRDIFDKKQRKQIHEAFELLYTDFQSQKTK